MMLKEVCPANPIGLPTVVSTALREMTVAPPAGLAPAGEPATPPLQRPQELRLTPEQFVLVCEANPEAVLELAADGAKPELRLALTELWAL